MKNRKAVFSALLGFTLFSTTLFAQNRLSEIPAEGRAKILTTRMTNTLKLDSAQVTEVGRINLVYAKKMDPLIQGNDSRMAKFKAFNEINSAKEKELKAVLSKEQFAQFKAQQEEMKKEMRKRRR